MNPIERLALFLALHYPEYTVMDIKLSAKPGYILAHGSLICIQKVGYPLLTADRKRVPINQLWVDLHDYFNAHVSVVKKRENGMVTVIEWDNGRYVYDYSANKTR